MGVAKIARRTFLVGAAAMAGGLAVGYYYYQRPYPNPLLKNPGKDEAVFNPFVKIAPDNKITVIVPRAEMGQGVSTTLAALVAEELEVGLSQITVQHGPASPAYFNKAVLEDAGPFPVFDQSAIAESFRGFGAVAGKLLGIQITGGSTSTKDAFEPMREAGAVTRHLLVKAAAEKWGKAPESLQIGDAAVIDPATGQKLTYGELAPAAAKLTVPDDIKTKPEEEWRLLGKRQSRVDVYAKSTGQGVFGIDVRLPDMLYATVRMNPKLGGGMKSFDASTAEKMPGVLKVVDIGGGIAVIANNTWRAFQAAEAVKVDWGPAPYPATTDGMFAEIGKRANYGEGFAFRNGGDVEEAFDGAPATDVIEAEYKAPFLAHACMEPMNATAQWRDGRLEIWSPTQVPGLVQIVAAREFDIAAEDVIVNVTTLGGGFGRRLEVDYDLYAMRAARQTGGKPVKVTWSREEDTRHDVYRPAAIGRFRGLIAKGGLPAALDANIASPSIIKSVVGRMWPYLPIGGPDKIIAEGSFDQPYAISNYRVSGAAVDLNVPIGFWRSVGNSYNGFFHESFIDELAHKSGMDPLKMRLKLMENWPVATAAMQKVADMSAWGEPMPQGRGKGCAFTVCFGSWVAEVVQVAVVDGAVRVEKVWCAVDVGKALDPGIIEAQMQSGIIFGLSAAMAQEITFRDGAVEQSNYDDFPVMRMNQAPEIEVAILQNADRMGGVGEPGTPPALPALANAIFAATGKRVRGLPLSKQITFAV
jgi:isoquinoline 1-oxidoreductase beta subunit